MHPHVETDLLLAERYIAVGEACIKRLRRFIATMEETDNPKAADRTRRTEHVFYAARTLMLVYVRQMRNR